jgi:hypothetical protein
MDIGRSLTFLLDDDAWPTKLGLGALIMFVPVLNFAAVGYEVRLIRNVLRDEPRPLPTWNDLGDLFMDGLWLALARLVYTLPMIGLFFCLPLAFLPLVVGAENERDVEQRLLIFFLIGGGVVLMVMVYAFVFGLISPAVTVQYVRQGGLGACFNWGAMLAFVRNNLGAYLVVWAMTLAAGFVLGAVIGPIGVVLNFVPCVGWLAYLALYGAGMFSVLLITGHLVGQLIRADAARGGGTAA